MSKKPIKAYQKLIEFYEELPKKGRKWIYRGEGENDALKTSLEKAFDNFGILTKKCKYDSEKDIIREFQRKVHHYTSNVPPRADIQQWLALMQHHGAPTRQLDWTYSFWVAVHFAIIRRKLGEKAKVWAVNVKAIKQYQDKYCEQKCVKNISRKIKKNRDLSYCDVAGIKDNALLHYLIRNNRPKPGVYALTSFRLNQRITIQQGTFLVAGDITRPFKDNLYACQYCDMRKKNVQEATIDINPELKVEIVKKLHEMNINNAVLFPGLQGFSESLWSRVGLPMENKLLPVEKEKLVLYP